MLLYLWLADMFWDRAYPDHFWIWRFLSSCRHLVIVDDEGRDFDRDVGLHNYTQLLLACSKSLQSLYLDSWFIQAPSHDFERIFHLPLFPRLKSLSLVLPLHWFSTSESPKTFIITLSKMFSKITSSHPIRYLTIEFPHNYNPTTDVPLSPEWAALDDSLSTTNISQILFVGEANDLSRSLLSTVFTKCRNKVNFAVKMKVDK
ncbi:hypothetical protein DL96DRAFT_720077 [Flagelloscypha sp. PMI_526]|nr:hypothetical protein DL96DRAFT_720077 [Flagelloscypha sp. PMI_526]